MLTSGESMSIAVVYNSSNCEIISAGEPKNIKDYNKPTVLNID